MRVGLDERVGPPDATQVDKFSPPREPHLEKEVKTVEWGKKDTSQLTSKQVAEK